MIGNSFTPTKELIQIIERIKLTKSPYIDEIMTAHLIDYWYSYHKERELLYLNGEIESCIVVGSREYLEGLRKAIDKAKRDDYDYT